MRQKENPWTHRCVLWVPSSLAHVPSPFHLSWFVYHIQQEQQGKWHLPTAWSRSQSLMILTMLTWKTQLFVALDLTCSITHFSPFSKIVPKSGRIILSLQKRPEAKEAEMLLGHWEFVKLRLSTFSLFPLSENGAWASCVCLKWLVLGVCPGSGMPNTFWNWGLDTD